MRSPIVRARLGYSRFIHAINYVGRGLTFLALIGMVFGPQAQAASYYWNTVSGAGTLWSDGTKWSDNANSAGTTGVVPGLNDTVTFNQSTINGAETVQINGATSVLGMTFANTGTTLLDNSAAGTVALTLGTGGITVNSGAGAVTLGNATNIMTLTLSGPQTWTNNSSNVLTITNAVAMGANPLTISGTAGTTISGVLSGTVPTGTTAITVNTGATLLLSNAANTFTGDILINGGTVQSAMANGTNSALGGQIGTVYRSVVLQNNGTYTQTATWDDNLPTTTNVGIVFNFAGPGNINVTTGTFTINDGTTAGTPTGSAQLQGAGTLTKIGTGQLTLGSGTTNFGATYTGAIIVSAGTVAIGGTGSGLGSTGAGTTVLTGAKLDVNGVNYATAEPLTITGTGTTNSGAISNTSATAATFAGPITLNGVATIGSTAAGGLTVTGGISGTGTLTLAPIGAGGVTVSTTAISTVGDVTISPNTSTGGVTVSSLLNNTGNLSIAGTNSGAITLSGGIANTVGNITFSQSSTGAVTISTGAINSVGTITNNGAGTGAVTISSVIGSGVTTLTQSSSGSLTLSAANLYTGATTINSGSIIVTNTTGSATSAGNVTVNAGILASGPGAVGIISGTVNAGTFAHAFAPGGFNSIGSLTVGGLTLSNTSTLGFDLSSPTSGDLLAVTGSTFTVTGTSKLQIDMASSTAGTFRLIQFGGAMPATSSFAFTGVSSRAVGQYSVANGTGSNAGYLVLNYTPSAAAAINATWIQSTGGTWNSDANWNTGSTPSIAGDTAILSSSIGTTAATITLDSAPHIGTLTFNNASTGAYTVSSGTQQIGTLIFDNGASTATINHTSSATDIISAPVVLLSNLNFVGTAGNLTISGAVSGTASITTAAGNTGNLTLSSAAGNTFVGNINHNGGTITVALESDLGPNSNIVNFTNNAILTYPNSGQANTTHVFNFGTGGGTINAPGTGTTGKVLMASPSQLTGAGTLTKSGGADFQLSVANPNFTGNINLTGGQIEVQNANALGSVGTVTISSGADLVGSLAGGFIPNPLNILNGGIVSSNANTSTFSGPVTVSSTGGNTFTVASRAFQTTTQGNNVTLSGNITGAANLALSTTQTSLGIASLVGDNTSWTTAQGSSSGNQFTLGTFQGLQFGTKSRPGGASGVFVNFSAGTTPTLGILTDGDGTGTPNTVTFTDTFTFAVSSAINVGKIGQVNTTSSQAFTNAANKLVVESNGISLGNLTLTVNNNNGYGLVIGGNTALSAATPTFSVATATFSNQTQGLTLRGQVSGSVGITKSGAGALVLANSAANNPNFSAINNFTGVVTVGQGVVSIDDVSELGTNASLINLNPNATTSTSTIRFTNSLSTSRPIVFGATQGTRSIEVTNGNTVTLTAPFTLTAQGALLKNDPGTLVLSANNSTWTGQLSINQGIVLLNTANAAGSGATQIIVATGALQSSAAVQIGGGITVSNPLLLNGTGQTQGVNFGGGLQAVGGTQATPVVDTWSGLITQVSAAAGLYGADAFTTLNITGGIAAGNSSYFTGAGTINLAGGTYTNTAQILWQGTGAMNVTVADTSMVANFTSNNGVLTLSGAGKLGAGGAAVVNPGGTMTLDDSGTVVANRLNGKSMTIGGKFNYTVNASTPSSESIGALTLNAGQSTFNINNAGAQTGTILFASLGTQNAGSAINFTGTLGTNNTINFSTAPTLTPAGGILARAVVNGADFATYGGANGTGIVATTYSTATDINAAALTDTFNATANTTSGITSSPTALGFYNQTLNAVRIAGTGLTFGSSASGGGVTLTSGGLLVTGGANTITSVVAFGANEGIVHVNSGSTLTMNGVFTGTAGVNKADGGTLRVTGSQYYTGTTYVNSGTLQLPLNSINPLFFNNALVVNSSGTLDLNGSSQMVSTLSTSAAASANNVVGGSIISSTNSGTLVVNGSASYSGTLSGTGVQFVRSGTGTNSLSIINSLTYGGPTLIEGGGLSNNTTLGGIRLVDNGALPNTSSISINYSSLGLDNSTSNNANSMFDLPDRIPNATPITLNGGSFNYYGRGGVLSTETIGAVTLNQGLNVLSATNESNNASGISGATLTITSLTRNAAAGATLVFAQNYQNNSNGNLGLIGDGSGRTENILVNGGIPLTNNIIGGWAIAMGTGSNQAYFFHGQVEFASYIPTLGVGGLNTTGFAGYDATAFPTVSQPTWNLRVGATATLPTVAGGLVVNALNLVNTTASTSIAMNFSNATDMLNVTSGGLIVQNVVGANNAAGTSGTATLGTVALPGRITAGGSNPAGTSDLDLYYYNSTTATTLTVNSIIVDNPNNGGQPVRLIAYGGNFGPGNITLAGANSYTGGTIVNGETVNIGATATLPAPTSGTGLTINNGTVTQVSGGIFATQSVVLNGGSTLTLVGNNTVTGLTINNNGGIVNPTVNTGGVLTVPGSGITATSSNPATTATINGTLDFGGSAAALTVNPIQFNGQNLAPLQATLNIAAAIRNANGLSWTGGGVLQLSGASTFTGGVALAGTDSLIIGGSSSPSAAGVPFGLGASGPLGAGTLTVGSGGTLLSSAAANTVANNISLAGDLNFNGVNNLTLNGTVTLPAVANTNINVAAPQMTAALGGNISGTSRITKTGLGTLNLAGNSTTFSGGVTLSSGQLQATGASPFGTGNVTISSGQLQLKNNIGANFSNTLVIDPALTNAFIDINNNGSNTAQTFIFNALTSQTSSVLNVSGGNNYRLQFNSTNLTSIGTPATFNPAAGLTIVLPGGFTDANRPVNVGAGTLTYSGSNSFTGGANVTTTLVAMPKANSVSTPFGTGDITLNGGATLQITPSANTLSSTGYTQGGLAARYFSFSQVPNTNATVASGLMPNATVGGITASDANISNHAPGINNNSGAQPIENIQHYVGLLNITTGGNYTFALNADDQAVVFVDGLPVTRLRDNTGAAGGFNVGFITGSYTLSAGLHQIAVMQQNGTGGSGMQVVYSGADTAGNPGLGFQNIALSKLYYNTAGVATAANGYLNAAQMSNNVNVPLASQITIDGAGSQYNSTIGTLNIGDGSIVTVNNLQGTGFIGVTGTTLLGSNNTINTNTGVLYLIGGVSDTPTGPLATAVIADGNSNGLNKTGNASLILGGSTDFTGPLNVNMGTVVVASPNALPTTATGITNVGNTGLLTTSSTVPASNANTVFTVTVTSSAGLVPGMGVTGTGVGANAYLVSITDPTHIVVAASGATTAGNPQLTFFSGGTLDLNGTTNVAGNIVLNGNGSPMALPATGALYNSSAALATVIGDVTIGSPINARNPAIGGYGDITISGNLHDGGSAQSWTKLGPNTLTLSGNNDFAGAITVSGGMLKVASANALGTGNNGTTMNAGTTLDLNGQTLAAGGTITLNTGTGITGLAMNNPLGGLINSSNTAAAIYNGPIALSASSSIGNANYAVNTAIYGLNASQLSGSFPLVPQPGDITLSNTISGAGVLTKVGNNTLFVTGQITSTGNPMLINGGQIVLSGGGAVAAATAFRVFNGASLTLDNSGTNVNNRLQQHSLSISGGNFTIIGNSTTQTQETLGSTVTTNFTSGGTPSGGSLITLIANPAQNLLFTGVDTAPGYAVGATALIRGTNLGVNSIASATAGSANMSWGLANPGYIGQAGAPGTVNRGILPWALVDSSATGVGTSFLAYDSTTNGVQAMSAADGSNTFPAYTQISASTTNGSANVTTTSTTGLVAGMDIVGPNIPAGSTISSITNGTTFVISNNATATATNTFAYSTGNNMVTTAPATAPASIVTQVNSLTLNSASGSSLAIPAGSMAQLDSGGILSLNGATAISGAGVLTTTANRPVIVHTPGSASLTLSATIANNTGGLVKADDGTLTLATSQLYTGDTTINGGTLKLGTSQAIFITPNQGQPAGSSGNNTSAQFFSVYQGGTFDLNGNNQMVANLNNNTTRPNNGGIITNSNNSTTSNFQVVLAGANRVFSGSMTGNLNFIRSSGWFLTLNAANTYTGTTTIQGGLTTLQDLGVLSNTSAINLNGGALIWDDTGSQAATRFPAATPVTFNTGAFVYQARNGVQGAISIGNTTLNSGSSLITVTPNNGGANLTIGTGTGTAITRNVGATVSFVSSGANAGIGDNAHVFIAGQSTGMIGAWATAYQIDSFIGQSVQPGFAVYNSNGIENLNPNLVTIATNNVPSGVNARANASLTLPVGGQTLNTLSIINAAVTVTFAASTDTLTLTAGGLLTGADNNAKAIGASAGQGQLTAGAGQSELFIHDGFNTLTINSKIIDNGVAGGLNVVVDSMGANQAANASNSTIALTAANTYLGTTYFNGINATLNSSGGPAIPGNLVLTGGVWQNDSLIATTTFSQSNQIATGATVTIKGGATLSLNGSSNTIANLVLDNTSGDLNGVGATLQTASGVLTVTGTISEPNNTNSFLVPQLNGFVNMTSTTPTITVAANPIAPNAVGLDITSALTFTAPTSTPLLLTGGGVIAINGQSTYANPTNVASGTTLAFGPASATNGSAATFPLLANSTVNLPSGATLDLRGNNGTIGALAGSGSVTNNTLTGATLTVGSDSLVGTPNNTSFTGTIANPFVQGLVGLTKIGQATFTLTADSIGSAPDSPNLGTLTVNGGGLTISGAGRAGFTTDTLNTGGTLLLDNTGTAVSNRLGGSFLLVSPTVPMSSFTARTLNMQGGKLTINGNSSAAVSEGIGSLNLLGGGIITLNAASTGGVNVSISSVVGQFQPTSLLIRGDGLGQVAGSGIATVAITTLPLQAQGSGGNGTTTMAIRQDILADASATGLGTGFLVKDSVTNLYRPMNQTTELGAIGTATANTNVGVSTANPGNISASVQFNSLTMLSGGGINSSILVGNPWSASGGLLNVDLKNTAGVLAFSGNTGITAGQIQSSSAITLDFHVVGAATTLNLNTAINSQSGFTKSDDGTLVLNQPHYINGSTGSNIIGVNGGTLKLAAGANTLYVQPQTSGTAFIPTTVPLQINNGTLDLNGNSQMVGLFTSASSAPFAGGTAANPGATLNNSSATAVNFITAPGNTASTFGGVISGNLSFYKQQTTNNQVTLTLTSPNTYTGSTNVGNGTLSLRDLGALTATSAINLNYGGLQLDNTGLADSTTRISASTPINFNGGTFSVSGGQSVETINVGPMNIKTGYNLITLSQYNNSNQTGSTTVNAASLTQTAGAMLNFINGSGVSIGATAGNPHLTVSGYSTTNLTNGIVGGWAIYNNTDFASYSNTQGVIALAAYSGNALGAGVATDNISVTATVQSVTSRTVNSLAIRNPGATTTVALFDASQVLNIGTGGLLINSGQTTNIQGGQLTAGGSTAAPATLYIFNNGGGAQTINSQIVNNGAQPVSVVRAGGGTLSLNPIIIDTVATITAATNTFTVNNAQGLFVGMGVTGTGLPAGEYISGIAGTTITVTTGSGITAASNSQLTFAPAVTTGTSTTNAGSSTVTTQGGAFSAGGLFVPTIGMAIGGPNIAGGTTITNIVGDNTSGFTFTLSQPALSSSTTAVVTVGAVSNTYTGATFNQGGSSVFGTLNLNGQPGSVVIPGDFTISNTGVNENTNQGQIAATSNVSWIGGGTLTLTGTNTLKSLSFSNIGTSGGTEKASGGTINLTAANAVTSVNDFIGTTPEIASTINFTNAGVSTINTSGLSLDNLVISGQITAPNGLKKTGTGSLLLPNANAAVISWDLNGGSLILNNATALGASGSTLAISGNGTLLAGSAALNVATPVTFNAGGNLTFGGTATTNQLTLSGNMNLNNVAPTISVSAAPLTATISGNISGAGGFTKAGAGALTLSGANAFTGPVSVTGGLLTMGSATALGGAGNNAADLSVGAGASLNLNANALSVGSLAGGGLITNSGAAVLLTTGAGSNANNTTFSGVLTAATPANLALTKTGANSLTLSGANLYAGATTLSGGTLVAGNATGSATGASTVTLNGGTLASATTGGTISGPVIANSGSNIIAPGGVGGVTTIGTLNLGSTLSLNASSTLDFDVNNSNNDLLAMLGTLSVSGTPTISIHFTGTPSGSNYTLATYTASGLANASFTSVGSLPSGYSLQVSGTSIQLVTTPTAIDGIWGVDASGNWAIGANWTGGTAPGLGASAAGNDTATFGSAAVTVDPTVSLNGVSPVLKAITFNNASKSYTVSGTGGGTLTLNNNASNALITVTAGTHTISAPLSLASNTNVSMVGGTSLTISGTQTWGGKNINVSRTSGSGTATYNLTGTQSVASPSTLTVGGNVSATIVQNTGTAGGGNLNVVVNGNAGPNNQGIVTFGDNAGSKTQNLASLSVNANGKAAIATHSDGGNPTHPGLNSNVLVTPTLTIADDGAGNFTGMLDIGNNKLIYQTGSLSNSAAATKTGLVYNMIRSGFNADAATNANNIALLWIGNGINSSAANLDSRHVTGIGMIQNNDATFSAQTLDGTFNGSTGNAVYTTFGGQATARNDIIVMYTYNGDIDLNGQITPSDYGNIDAAFAAQQTTHVNRSGWVNGDFDYNGVITPNDYSLIDAANAAQSGVQLGGDSGGLITGGGSMLSGGGSSGGSLGSVTAVPEPSTWILGLLSALGFAALARRRKRLAK